MLSVVQVAGAEHSYTTVIEEKQNCCFSGVFGYYSHANSKNALVISGWILKFTQGSVSADSSPGPQNSFQDYNMYWLP